MALTKVSRGLLSTGIVDNSTTTAITIDSSENVGIGTSSPSVNLEITESGSATNSVADVLKLNHITSGTAASGLGAGVVFSSERPSGGINLTRGAIYGISGSDPDDDGALAFYTRTNTSGSGFSEKLRIDSSGNVGIGVVPSAWGTGAGVRGLEVGANLAASQDINSVYFSANAYNSATGWKYRNTQYAANLRMGTNDSVFQFQQAASGTAGAAITWATSMTLDASGRLLVGLTGASGYGTIETDTFTTSGQCILARAGGNLLVGKTSTALATAGHTLSNDGYVYHTRAGDIMFLNRLGSGTCLYFLKDGAITGSISTNSNSLPSDRNFKTNINDLTLGLNFVNSLKPVTYNYKIDDADQPVMAGLIAQDVEESLNEAGVAKNSMTMLQHKPLEDEKQSDYQIDYLKLVPVLINAIQELKEELNTATARITELENN